MPQMPGRWDQVYTTGATEAFCEVGAACLDVDYCHFLHRPFGDVAVIGAVACLAES